MAKLYHQKGYLIVERSLIYNLCRFDMTAGPLTLQNDHGIRLSGTSLYSNGVRIEGVVEFHYWTGAAVAVEYDATGALLVDPENPDRLKLNYFQLGQVYLEKDENQ